MDVSPTVPFTSLIPIWLWFAWAVTLITVVFTYLFMQSDDEKSMWLPDENTYVDPNKKEQVIFAPITKPASLYVSLIVPAYQEKERIPIMLDATLTYLKNKKKKDPSFTYEILVVNDGSKDSTGDVVLKYVQKESVDTIRLLNLKKNRGKGGAVKRGMMCARGRYLLMVDADGATEISDLDRLDEQIHNVERDGLGVAVGSRAHLVNSDVVAKRSLFRNILMYGFHILVQVLGVRGVKDTQCGFKLFTRRAAQALFRNLHIERWAFDVELLYRAQVLNIPIVEVPVNWQEIPGSKLGPISSSFQMAKDLARIRFAYMLGIWEVKKPI